MVATFIFGFLTCWLVFQLALGILILTDTLDTDNNLVYWMLCPIFMLCYQVFALIVVLVGKNRFTWNYDGSGKFWRWFNAEEYKQVIESRDKRKADFEEKYNKAMEGKFVVYKEICHRYKEDDNYEMVESSKPLDYKEALKLFRSWSKEYKEKWTNNLLHKTNAKKTSSSTMEFVTLDTLEEFNSQGYTISQ